MKRRKKVLAILLSCTVIFSTMQPAGVFAAEASIAEEAVQESRSAVNLALNAAMTSNGNETDSFTAVKANDGSLDTRWASTASVDEKWLCMNFGSEKTVGSVVIEWERKNPTEYLIQSSTDGSTWNDVKTLNSVPDEFKDIINFDSPVTAQYIRVLVKNFNRKAPDRAGKEVDWPTVSIYEFEAYDSAYKPGLNLDDIAPVYNSETNMVEVDVPEGYTVTNNGADFEQIVADDFRVQQPLTDKEVKIALKFTETETGKVTIAKEHAITIPGLHSDSTGNEKPQVIPEIAEWYSDSTEDFTLSGSGEIIIASEDLRYAGEEFQKDLKDQTGITLPVKVGQASAAGAGDFFFTLGSDDQMMGEEGYTLDIGDAVRTEAIDATGAYWATRTILQTLKLSDAGTAMPKGQMRDYPKYPVRGFVFDVGRKPVSMETLENVAKNMAWYKMNDFQVHLSDNYIFLEDYYNDDAPNPADAYDAYDGYRLESGIQKNGVSIASEDYHYTKQEFKDFIQECRNFGVDIVPEIDVPAHAMAITKVFPEYAVNDWNPRTKKRSIVDHLDISRPEVVDFTKTIFDDYINDGTFDKDTTVHIGADEFEASATAYREFLNTMINHVKETNTTRLWGGLTWIKDNKTEILPETTKDVQINLWSKDWADGVEMYNLGFDLINTLDTFGYMVPNGTGNTGAYADYINKTSVFNSFAPNSVARSAGGFTSLPSGDKQVIGGAYAIWEDNIDKKASGLSEEDLFIRFFDALPLFAEKTWANGQEKGSVAHIDALADVISTAPNSNPYAEETSVEDIYAEYKFDSTLEKDNSENGRDLSDPTNVTTVSANGSKALKLNGGASYVKSPVDKLGSTGGKAISFTINLDEVKPGQILFEEDSAYGTHDIRIMEGNKLGFTRELYEYEFDYEVKPGTVTDIMIVTTPQKTALYVNNEFAANATGRFVHNDMVKKSGITNASFALPTERIGSESNAVKGTIDNIRITGAVSDPSLVPAEDFQITCDNENALVQGKEGPAYLAFDGNTGTIWHTNYTPKQDLPATITVDLGQTYTLNKLGYLPRQDGGEGNGIVTEYSISVSTDGTDYTEVSSGNLADDATEKLISFDLVDARYLKFTAKAGKNDFASAAEITLHQSVGKSSLQNLYNSLKDTVNTNYTEESWNKFQTALKDAKDVLDNESAAQSDIIAAATALNKAYKGLTEALPEIDKAALQGLYDAWKDTVNDSYTKDSWDAFQTARSNAKKVLDDANATQKNVDDALEALNTAAEGLKKEPDGTSVNKDVLQSLYDTWKNTANDNYTKESWDAFQNALTTAKNVLADEVSNQNAVDAAASALKTASEGLKKNVPVPTADKAALQSLYNSLAGYREASYTADSWKAFAAALANAKAVLANQNADQNTVNQAVTVLQNAKNALKPAPVAPQLPKKGSTTSDKHLKYKVTASTNKSKTVTVTGPLKKTNKKITVPATIRINGYTYKVTAVADKAFRKNAKLKSVTLGKNITKIGKESFSGCKALTTVLINSSGVKNIGKNAFKGISSKAKIKVPKKKLTLYRKFLKKAKISSKIKIVKK